MNLLMSKNRVAATKLIERFCRFKAGLCAIESDSDETAYFKEAKLAMLDICDAAEKMYSGELTKQQAADYILDQHYERTKNWDILCQEITDCVTLSIMIRYFGKPYK